MGLTIDSVDDVGGDVLQVAAHDDDGTAYAATGWVSATTNHYDPSAYDESGDLVEGSQSRAMTPDEVGTYAMQLLVEQSPELAARSQQTPVATAIAFNAPALELAPEPPTPKPITTTSGVS
jgi:hypothetical protein